MNVYLDSILALFAILNPIGNIPVFIEVVSGIEEKLRRRLFNLTALTGFLTLLALAICGEWVMKCIFHIEMSEFKIAGGILLIIIAVRNIAFGGAARRASGDVDEILQVGVVPLAIPLLVGPGAITTAILILHRNGLGVAVISIMAVFLATWIILHCSQRIYGLLGRFGSLALSRILQIFIAAIGVRFLVAGIREVILDSR